MPEDIGQKNDSKVSFGERIAKWMIVKAHIKWIFGCIFIVLALLFLLSCIYDSYKWIGNLIGFVGGVASLLGILLTLFQLVDAKKNLLKLAEVTEATKKASEETRKSVRKTISTVQITKYCEVIKLIQIHLSNEDFSLTIHLIQELKDAIIDLKSHVNALGIDVKDDAFSEHITQMGVNIALLRKAAQNASGKHKGEAINQDFDKLLTLLLEIKAQLTNN